MDLSNDTPSCSVQKQPIHDKKKSGNVHHIQNIPEDYANDLQ